ncbi:MAG: hypothetical protein M1579_04280 [Gammaproteobacteria bacterium]|nr:hypothetical protein [Gammaproteobacteria bacterium]
MIETSTTVKNYIDAMHQAHLDNAAMVYSGHQGIRSQTLMPATPFIFDYFIYNSLYSVDWNACEDHCEMVYFDRSEAITESKQQLAFEKYISCKTDKSFKIFHKAFEPFSYIDLTGDWTQTLANGRVSKEDGEQFWKRAMALQALLNESKEKISSNDLNLVKQMRFFVYHVRNNIFHGSKQVGIHSDMDNAHKKRLQIYDLFIRCLMGWFFLAMGRKTIASSKTQIAVDGLIEQDKLIKALNLKLIKAKDCFLLPKMRSSLAKMLSPSEEVEQGALLYPACGTDWLTPLLIGLPYCDEFIFVDHKTCAYGELKRGRIQPERLVSWSGCTFPRDPVKDRPLASLEAISDGVSELKFKYQGKDKKITFIHDDANRILTLNKPIRMFFHRDDAGGESTSNIGWLAGETSKLKTSIRFTDDAVFITNMRVDEAALTCVESFSDYSSSNTYKLGYVNSDKQ